MTLNRSFLILAYAAFVVGCGQAPSTNNTQTANATPAAPSSPAPAAPVDVLAQGRKLYADNCAGCHKEDGRGGKITIEGKSINPDDLTSAKIKGFSDEKIYGYIYNGVEDEGMPAFKDDLSEAQIREVVRYLRSDIQKISITSTPGRPVAPAD